MQRARPIARRLRVFHTAESYVAISNSTEQRSLMIQIMLCGIHATRDMSNSHGTVPETCCRHQPYGTSRHRVVLSCGCKPRALNATLGALVSQWQRALALCEGRPGPGSYPSPAQKYQHICVYLNIRVYTGYCRATFYLFWCFRG